MSESLEIVRRPHAANMIRLARAHPEVVVLSADLTSSCEVDDFRRALPERFFSLGMAEQNMMGFAAGMAREGLRPFVHTFAVFATRRPYDQVAMSIAYPNLPVRLVGFLPGVTTPGGVTHQAIDDIALMRALPNMTVLACADATEVESVLEVADGVEGPVYIRMQRGEVARLFDTPMTLGQGRMLSDGDDLAIFSYGVATLEVRRATAALQRAGVGVRHVHLSTLKPLDRSLVRAAADVRRGVIVLENHSTIGGLGSAIAEVLAEKGGGVPLVRLGLQDTYAHGASRAYLMGEYGLDAAAVVVAAERSMGRALGIESQHLPPLYAAARHSGAKAEAL